MTEDTLAQRNSESPIPEEARAGAGFDSASWFGQAGQEGSTPGPSTWRSEV